MKSLIQNLFDDILATSQYPFMEKPLQKIGFKDIIRRPHNLYVIKDEDGNTEALKLDVVTTPFRKEDVKIEVVNDIMTITCGNENYKEEDHESMVYHGISSQVYSFSLKLAGIDQKNITAKITDGILTVKLPTVKKEQPGIMTINID